MAGGASVSAVTASVVGVVDSSVVVESSVVVISVVSVVDISVVSVISVVGVVSVTVVSSVVVGLVYLLGGGPALYFLLLYFLDL